MPVVPHDKVFKRMPKGVGFLTIYYRRPLCTPYHPIMVSSMTKQDPGLYADLQCSQNIVVISTTASYPSVRYPKSNSSVILSYSRVCASISNNSSGISLSTLEASDSASSPSCVPSKSGAWLEGPGCCQVVYMVSGALGCRRARVFTCAWSVVVKGGAATGVGCWAWGVGVVFVPSHIIITNTSYVLCMNYTNFFK